MMRYVLETLLPDTRIALGVVFGQEPNRLKHLQRQNVKLGEESPRRVRIWGEALEFDDATPEHVLATWQDSMVAKPPPASSAAKSEPVVKSEQVGAPCIGTADKVYLNQSLVLRSSEGTTNMSVVLAFRGAVEQWLFNTFTAGGGLYAGQGGHGLCCPWSCLGAPSKVSY